MGTLGSITSDAVYSVGNAWTKIDLSGARYFMRITHDPLGEHPEVPELYFTYVDAGAPAPTRTLPEDVIATQGVLDIRATQKIDVYIKNSSGDATEVPYTARAINDNSVPFGNGGSGVGGGGSGGSAGIISTVRPQNIAVIQLTTDNALLNVEAWDSNYTPLLFDGTDASIQVALTGGAATALFDFIAGAGVEPGATIPGMPDGTVGCRVQVDDSSVGAIAFNFAGSDDGSGVNGIDASSAGPVVTSPRKLYPGDSITVGLQ
jgi:hypothetical protein